jgi:TRAP-type C4-dicarboxylate transport system substrate-binding protein
VAHVNRIKGLCAIQGIYDYEPLRSDRLQRLDKLLTGDGRGLPARFKAEIVREIKRLEIVLEMIATVEAERDGILRNKRSSHLHADKIEGNMCGTAMRGAEALPGSKATSPGFGPSRQGPNRGKRPLTHYCHRAGLHLVFKLGIWRRAAPRHQAGYPQTKIPPPAPVIRGSACDTVWRSLETPDWEDNMGLGKSSWAKRTMLPYAACFASATLSFALIAGAAEAQTKPQGNTYIMKITTPTINAAPDTYARNLAAAVKKDSGGRIAAEVFPASQLGSIPRQIEGTQFGAIQCAVIPPDFFVGVDPRFQVLAAPGLISSMEQGQRVAADPAVLKLMLSLGANKGLRGVGLFMAEQSEIISRTPLRHLADFKGKKIRVFASDFQAVAMERLGVTPVAMSLGDVLPALQQGAIDGAVAGIQVFTGMHFFDASKHITMTHQPAIFLIVEVNRNWYESLPPNLQEIVSRDAAEQAVAINPQAEAIIKEAVKGWQAHGGELISLPANEQTEMLNTLASVGTDVSAKNPTLAAAYETARAAAQRALGPATQ